MISALHMASGTSGLSQKKAKNKEMHSEKRDRAYKSRIDPLLLSLWTCPMVILRQNSVVFVTSVVVCPSQYMDIIKPTFDLLCHVELVKRQ